MIIGDWVKIIGVNDLHFIMKIESISAKEIVGNYTYSDPTTKKLVVPLKGIIKWDEIDRVSVIKNKKRLEGLKKLYEKSLEYRDSGITNIY